MTVLYSSALPKTFKDYASKISISTSSVQYENDDVMKPVWGDDYSICCCVSATQTGKEMQFFGARANLAKCLLYAINGGVDEKLGEQVGPAYAPITAEYLDYNEVMARYDVMMDWLAGLYVNILNLIQYMHDKYYYEAAEMALIDTPTSAALLPPASQAFSQWSTLCPPSSTPRSSASAMSRASSPITRSRAISRSTATMMTAPMTSLLSCCAASWRRSSAATPTATRSLTTSILTITSNVVYGRPPALCPMVARLTPPVCPPAATRPMVPRPTACWHP